MATISDRMERLSKAPTKHKVAALLLITALICALFYFVFYSDLSTQFDSVESQIALLQTEVSSYEEKKQKYMAFRAEVNKLLEEQKELVKVLPTSAEIPSFLQSLHAQGELAGLSILTFQPGLEIPQNFYARIPVKMAISGTFHQVNKFFYSVGQLKRIVALQDVALTAPTPTEHGVLLNASFMASTYRFIAPQGAPPPSNAGG